MRYGQNIFCLLVVTVVIAEGIEGTIPPEDVRYNYVDPASIDENLHAPIGPEGKENLISDIHRSDELVLVL